MVTRPDLRPAAQAGSAGVENSSLNQTLVALRQEKEAALQDHQCCTPHLTWWKPTGMQQMRVETVSLESRLRVSHTQGRNTEMSRNRGQVLKPSSPWGELREMPVRLAQEQIL